MFKTLYRICRTLTDMERIWRMITVYIPYIYRTLTDINGLGKKVSGFYPLAQSGDMWQGHNCVLHSRLLNTRLSIFNYFKNNFTVSAHDHFKMCFASLQFLFHDPRVPFVKLEPAAVNTLSRFPVFSRSTHSQKISIWHIIGIQSPELHCAAWGN